MVSRFRRHSGIAIGPILMVLALIAVIMTALSIGTGDLSGAISQDRISNDLRAQIDMVKAKIGECVYMTRRDPPHAWARGLYFSSGNQAIYDGNIYTADSSGTAGTSDPLTSIPPTHTSGSESDGNISWTYVEPFEQLAYPPDDGMVGEWETSTAYGLGDIVVNGSNTYRAATAGTSGSTAPVHTSGTVSDGAVDWEYMSDMPGTPVADLKCPRDPSGQQNLWTGVRPANLPAPPNGFTEWMYRDHGNPELVSPGGTCIYIQPRTNQAADPALRRGITTAIDRLSSTEYTYDPGSTNQRLIIWIRRPATGTDC
ncbi:MAG: hypothetical protein AB7G06_08155 [Bdellovibrionales bacterium]